MTRTTHPDDRWIDVTQMGDTEPRFILVYDGHEAAISQACAHYIHGNTTIDALEQDLDQLLGLDGDRAKNSTTSKRP